MTLRMRFHVLRALATTEKRICSLCIYIISVRTHAGCSIAPDLMQMGACNQEKKTFKAKSMQSGATPPPRLLLERIFRMHAYAFLKKQAKKSPAIGFLVPFYVKHSKGFVSALCDQSK